MANSPATAAPAAPDGRTRRPHIRRPVVQAAAPAAGPGQYLLRAVHLANGPAHANAPRGSLNTANVSCRASRSTPTPPWPAWPACPLRVTMICQPRAVRSCRVDDTGSGFRLTLASRPAHEVTLHVTVEVKRWRTRTHETGCAHTGRGCARRAYGRCRSGFRTFRLRALPQRRTGSRVPWRPVKQLTTTRHLSTRRRSGLRGETSRDLDRLRRG
jgi:hypothetical protein